MQFPDFLIIPYQLLADERLTPTDRTVYAIVYWFANMKLETCTASNVTLGKYAITTAHNVGKALQRLDECGYIERIFKDPETKKIRAQIIPLVSFSKGAAQKGYLQTEVPPSGTKGTSKRSVNVPPNGGQRSNTKSKKKSIAASAAPAIPAPPFNAMETRQRWFDGELEDFQLLAWFFDEKQLWKKFDTRAKVEHAVPRHIRAARRIIRGGWSQKECATALTQIKKNDKLISEWQLETLEKYLTK